MEEVIMNDIISHCLNDDYSTKKPKTRLEASNKFIFSIFRAFGFFPIKWESTQRVYVIRPVAFVISYLFWFFWPLIGLAIALIGRYSYSFDGSSNEINKVTGTSLFIFCFAVVPAINTYSINLISRYLPDVLEDIASLGEMDVAGFHIPMSIPILKRKQKALKKKENFIKSVGYNGHNKILFVLPIITVVLSICAFVTAWIYGILHVMEWDTFYKEWPFLTMVFTYLTQPAITNWLCVIFIEWLRLVYEALRVELEYFYYVTVVALNNNDSSAKSTSNPNTDTVSFNENKIEFAWDYVDKLQEIFIGIIEGFVKFITSVNVLVFLVSSVLCTLELLRGFHLIVYMVPLAIALGHMALICYMSNCLMDEYDRILLVLKKLVRLERRNPDLLPYNKLHILRENLLESPPQVVIFGGYRVGNGLLIAAQGFILSYTMLANDILDIETNPIKNSTLCRV